MQVYILAFVIALFTSWLLTPYVKKLAFRIGALDKPDGRKVHKGIMPRLGGLAIYLGFVVAVLCSMHLSKDVMALLLGGTALLMMFISCRQRLSCWGRLLPQPYWCCLTFVSHGVIIPGVGIFIWSICRYRLRSFG